QGALALREQDGRPEAAELLDKSWALTEHGGRLLGRLYRRIEDSVDLSVREREIVELVCAGNAASEIASRLVLSPRTVEYHLASAYKKVGVSDRAALQRSRETWLAVG
ncbi:MAG: helix-turn-helix transcriptional regulator, partial [Promicromonosporaceae bacterium]|nr:helix-turn-helix transcriptional regulator [Promicromonosporaceae bacterium]